MGYLPAALHATNPGVKAISLGTHPTNIRSDTKCTKSRDILVSLRKITQS